jgi:NAD(P)-dependent dehydrogenase (short-subunit alcohol dehydrogenase family)
MRLKDRVALITGGNSGIGLATARLFIAEGARVAIVGRDESKLQQAAEELGDGVLVIQADLADYNAIPVAIQKAVSHFGNLDILFANAGIASSTPVGSTLPETFAEVLAVNVTSIFLLVQAAVPYLNHSASIIFNGSVQGINGRPGHSAYAASKGALRAMARTLASELSPQGIRVNVISPGAIKTPMLSKVAPTEESRKALFQQMEAGIPLGRMGHSHEVANAVLFLASPESSFIQAAEIFVDGGATGAPMGAPIYSRASNQHQIE